MKVKENHSSLAEEAAAKGAMGLFGGIAVFIGGFVLWSASCMGGAIIDLLA